VDGIAGWGELWTWLRPGVPAEASSQPDCVQYRSPRSHNPD
jgi:hypothetical protein